jgi:hypothetical protein
MSTINLATPSITDTPATGANARNASRANSRTTGTSLHYCVTLFILSPGLCGHLSITINRGDPL